MGNPSSQALDPGSYIGRGFHVGLEAIHGPHSPYRRHGVGVQKPETLAGSIVFSRVPAGQAWARAFSIGSGVGLVSLFAAPTATWHQLFAPRTPMPELPRAQSCWGLQGGKVGQGSPDSRVSPWRCHRRTTFPRLHPGCATRCGS